MVTTFHLLSNPNIPRSRYVTVELQMYSAYTTRHLIVQVLTVQYMYYSIPNHTSAHCTVHVLPGIYHTNAHFTYNTCTTGQLTVQLGKYSGCVFNSTHVV